MVFMMRSRIQNLNNVIALILLMGLAACGRASPGRAIPTQTSLPPALASPSLALTPAATPRVEIALTPTEELTPPHTPTTAPSPTLDVYAGLGIDDLAARTYGGGQLEIRETLAVTSYFTRSLVTFPSDGLTIYGFMNVPRRAEPPFPVVIALHGYIDPGIYSTLDYTTRYADALARAGFLVLHPNLRGYPPSDSGDNRFRVGMAIDVLNLIALVKEQAGKPGPLVEADPRAIGLWGHSMGGGIVKRVITVSPDVKAAILYGAMSGDDRQNYERIYSYFSNGTRGLEELGAPEEAFRRISPVYYYDRINAAVSVHHGEQDPDVPPAWSRDTCQRLRDLGKNVECFTYPGEMHTFHGEGDQLFIERSIDFYRRWLTRP